MSPPPAQFSDLASYLSRILNYSLSLAGMAAFVMLLKGGFDLLVSGGDPKSVEKGQKTIQWAIFGLVAMLGAWFVLKIIGSFINGSGGGFDLTQFKL